jgi:hypothetical protein
MSPARFPFSDVLQARSSPPRRRHRLHRAEQLVRSMAQNVGNNSAGSSIYSAPFVRRRAMQTSDLYRQRAAECERLAQKHPEQQEHLQKVAQTWLLLAKAAEELSEAAKTLH